MVAVMEPILSFLSGWVVILISFRLGRDRLSRYEGDQDTRNAAAHGPHVYAGRPLRSVYGLAAFECPNLYLLAERIEV